MKQMWNTADHGGKHHDPLNGLPAAWVRRLKEAGSLLRGSLLPLRNSRD